MWGEYGIRFVAQLLEAGSLKSFEQLCSEFSTPKNYLFRPFQLRHTLLPLVKAQVSPWHEN